MKFNELDMKEPLQHAVADMGFEEATPIQEQSIPIVMQGQDLVGQAQTGTGKTAAFGIPLLENVDARSKHVQALILCPTRELAIQISDELHKLAKYMSGIRILPIYGGQEIYRQIRPLRMGVQIVVGTPGRVMDHMRRGTLNLEHLRMIALDEADEMLNMGFREDIETILAGVPEDRQTIMYSATIAPAIMEIARTYMREPAIIRITRKELTVSNISQYYYSIRPDKKNEALARLIDAANPRHSMIFCNTKRQVDELCSFLRTRGYSADGLHGDLKQQQRDHVMGQFRTGQVQFLVATDVAARGIDVDDIDAVFNYDLPQDCEYYVHRIGRTGRAGRDGIAHSLVTRRDMSQLYSIQSFCKTKIENRPLPREKDVLSNKMALFFRQIDETLEKEDLEDVEALLQENLSRYEEEVSQIRLMAALYRITMGPAVSDAESLEDDFSQRTQSRFTPGRPRMNQNRKTEVGMVRLFVSVGKRDNVRPGDLVGAIAGESGIAGKSIGAIDIYDNFSFVDVPQGKVTPILKSLTNKKIKGREIHVEIARASR